MSQKRTPTYCTACGDRLTATTKMRSPVGRRLTVHRRCANAQKKVVEVAAA